MLFHSITSSQAFSACLLHTNKLIINEDTNWGLFPWKILQPCPSPRLFHRYTSACISFCAFSLCLCLAGAELPVPAAHSSHFRSRPAADLCKGSQCPHACPCVHGLLHKPSKELGSFIHSFIGEFLCFLWMEVTLPAHVSDKNTPKIICSSPVHISEAFMYHKMGITLLDMLVVCAVQAGVFSGGAYVSSRNTDYFTWSVR